MPVFSACEFGHALYIKVSAALVLDLRFSSTDQSLKTIDLEQYDFSHQPKKKCSFKKRNKLYDNLQFSKFTSNYLKKCEHSVAYQGLVRSLKNC